MIESPVETLTWLRPWIPPALVPADARSRIEVLAAALPAIRALCFECRLAPTSRRVDFIAAVSAGWGRDELSAAISGARTGPGWEGLSALCTAWGDPTDRLHEEIPCIWIEFDLHASARAVPEPFVSCCVQPRFYRGRLSGGPGADTTRVRGSVERTARVLGRGALDPAALRTALHCMDALPPRAAVMHVASSEVRGVNGLRMVLVIEKGEAPAYLDRIGWHGDPATLRALLQVAAFSSEAELYLDIGDRVLPSLGSASPLLPSAEDPRVRRMLDRLVGEGLCAPEKRDGAIAWMGSERAVLPGTRWPCEVRRYLSLKVVHRPGQPMEAKAYLELYGEFRLAN